MDDKLQQEINKDTAKIAALSSGRINKYEYRTEEKILPSGLSHVIGQAKFTYFLLGKKTSKTD